MTAPVLWYLNRGSGVTLLAVLTLSTLLGILATGRGATTLWPRFLTQGLHRAIAGLSVLMLIAHVATAVVDDYVDIRWWQALVPFGATYRTLPLELGVLALDLIALVAVTALLRERLPEHLWRGVHLTTYVAYGVAVAHGVGIGTDAGEPWFRSVTIVCVGLVVVAATVRLLASVVRPLRSRAVAR